MTEKIHTQEEIDAMVSSNEISVADSFVLEFKLKKHLENEKEILDLLSISSKGAYIPETKLKMSTNHIKAICRLIFYKGSRLTRPECVDLSESFGVSSGTLGRNATYISFLMFPEQTRGKASNNQEYLDKIIIPEFEKLKYNRQVS